MIPLSVLVPLLVILAMGIAAFVWISYFPARDTKADAKNPPNSRS